MAKQKKVLRAKKQRDRSHHDDDSLLLRSAESLGRVIGALQRQLDGATKHLSETASDALNQLPSMRETDNTVTPSQPSTRRRSSPTAPKKTARRKLSTAKKGSAKKGSRRQMPPSRKRTSTKKIRDR